VLFKDVIPAGPDVNHGLVIPWIVFYVIATVISVVALMLKARVFLQQLRERRSQLAEDTLEDGQTERAKKLKKHRKRLVKTTRAILLTYSSLMVAVAECLPLGILQVMYSLRVAKMDRLTAISLVTKWSLLGLKVAKVPELSVKWEYKKKQNKKCATLAAFECATDGADYRDGAGVLFMGDERARSTSLEMMPSSA